MPQDALPGMTHAAEWKHAHRELVEAASAALHLLQSSPEHLTGDAYTARKELIDRLFSALRNVETRPPLVISVFERDADIIDAVVAPPDIFEVQMPEYARRTLMQFEITALLKATMVDDPQVRRRKEEEQLAWNFADGLWRPS